MHPGGLEPKNQRLRALINRLHTTDCAIDNETLEGILAFGEFSVPHLEAIIKTALQKSARANLLEPRANTDWFVVVHALYLIAHLRSHESLDIVLTFLAQKQTVLDYWLLDLLDEDLWEIPFLVGSEDLSRLERFVLERKNNKFSRLAVCAALVQVALHFPEKMNKIVEIFEQALLLTHEDPDFIGLVASEALDLKDARLKAAILKALETNSVFEGILSPEDVELAFRKTGPRKITPVGLFDKYDYFRDHPYFSKTAAPAAKQFEQLRKAVKAVS